MHYHYNYFKYYYLYYQLLKYSWVAISSFHDDTIAIIFLPVSDSYTGLYWLYDSSLEVDSERTTIKHYNVDLNLLSPVQTYITSCDNTLCTANTSTSGTLCTFQATVEHLFPILTTKQFLTQKVKQTKLINYNIFNLFDIAKQKFYSSQRVFYNNPNQYIFEFYTDGSLIDIGSEQCSVSCAFAHLNDEFDIPNVEFSTTIDKWPSAYRGKLLAVVLALIVVPHHTRDYFKLNNNYLWNILCRVIRSLNLNVELFKVSAHSNDMFNNYVDILAKSAHSNDDKFITRYKGMESFINLHRNMKYQKLEVDWTSTFYCLSNDIKNNETSLSSSKIKSHKVHLLLEEIPTIEQMKKSFLEIYDGWLCPSCRLEDETFTHVWLCVEYQDKLINVITISTLDIWDLDYNPDKFTLIDLIKGIVPLTLYQKINSWMSKNDTLKILSQLRQFIFEQVFVEIWIPRCTHLKEFEFSLGLTKKKKLTFKNYRSLVNNNNSRNNIEYSFDALDSIKNYIYFGKNIIEYYTNYSS
ncbi:ribonuclease H-like domain-containing protein [Rhizophagus clarus]|uniref:Ribonuclease H-like domain-containing protein n=1 Tax=Rhizophagus clarus TaxID=94130 RepID=A0A8H3R2I2_9GLOM|nr:ribonuclease H-like domain-containing protein [Rhizophagus clarus]